MTIWSGDVVESSTVDHRPSCAAESCSCLASLQRIDFSLSELNEPLKSDVCAATDCLGVVRKLENQVKVINMATKLNPIAREFFLIKSKRLKSIAFMKVDVG